jgi:hypothetical protein
VSSGHDATSGVHASEEPATCSRAGCREPALWRIEWRNPKIHSPDRRKIWVACDAHRDFLRDYLAARDFPVAVAPLTPLPASTPTRDAS